MIIFYPIVYSDVKIWVFSSIQDILWRNI